MLFVQAGGTHHQGVLRTRSGARASAKTASQAGGRSRSCGVVGTGKWPGGRPIDSKVGGWLCGSWSGVVDTGEWRGSRPIDRPNDWGWLCESRSGLRGGGGVDTDGGGFGGGCRGDRRPEQEESGWRTNGSHSAGQTGSVDCWQSRGAGAGATEKK